MSKFAGLFDEPKAASNKSAPRKKAQSKPKSPAPPPKAEERKTREAGKRSDPAFRQITAYLRKETLPDFKAKLEKAGLDMSEFFQGKVDEYLEI